MNYDVAETEAFRVEEGGVDLRDRTTAFALRVVKMFVALPKTDEARVLGKQVLRSGPLLGRHLPLDRRRLRHLVPVRRPRNRN